MPQLITSIIIFVLTFSLLTILYSLYVFHRDKRFYTSASIIQHNDLESTIGNITTTVPIIIELKKSEEDLIDTTMQRLSHLFYLDHIIAIYKNNVIHICVTLTPK